MSTLSSDDSLVLMWRKSGGDYPTIPASLSPDKNSTSDSDGHLASGYAVLAYDATSYKLARSLNLDALADYQFKLVSYFDSEVLGLSSNEKTAESYKTDTGCYKYNNSTKAIKRIRKDGDNTNLLNDTYTLDLGVEDLNFNMRVRPRTFSGNCILNAYVRTRGATEMFRRANGSYDGSNNYNANFDLRVYEGANPDLRNTKRVGELYVEIYGVGSMRAHGRTAIVTILQPYRYVPKCIPTSGVAVSSSDGSTDLLSSDTLTISDGSAGTYKLNFDKFSDTACPDSNLRFEKDSGADWITLGSYGSASVSGYDSQGSFSVAKWEGTDATLHGTTRSADVWIEQVNDTDVKTDTVTVTQTYDYDPPLTFTCVPEDCSVYPTSTGSNVVDGYSNRLVVTVSGQSSSDFSGDKTLTVSTDVSADKTLHEPASINRIISTTSSVVILTVSDTIRGSEYPVEFSVDMSLKDNMGQSDGSSGTFTFTARHAPGSGFISGADCRIAASPDFWNVGHSGGSVGYVNLYRSQDDRCPELADLSASDVVTVADWIYDVSLFDTSSVVAGTDANVGCRAFHGITNDDCYLYKVKPNTGDLREATLKLRVSIPDYGILESKPITLRQRAPLRSNTCEQMDLRADSSKTQTYEVNGYYRGEGMTKRWTHLSLNSEGGGCAPSGMQLPGAGIYHICGSNNPSDCGNGRAGALAASDNRTDPKAVKDSSDNTIAEWVAIRVNAAASSAPECDSTARFSRLTVTDGLALLHFGCSDDSLLLRDDDLAAWDLTNVSLAQPSAQTQRITFSAWKTPIEDWGVWEITCPSNVPTGGLTLTANYTYDGVASNAQATGVCAP